MIDFLSSQLEALTKELGSLDDFHSRLQAIAGNGKYTEPESSICLPADREARQAAADTINTYRSDRLKYVVIVGIGGSNLGAKAVYDALFGAFDVIEPDRLPKLLFAETTDPEWLERARQLLARCAKPEEFMLLYISKSGTTTETAANYELLAEAIKDLEPDTRTIAITDEGSQLWETAHWRRWGRLAIPKLVGGRFSVLSAVGLLPLALAGIDIVELLDGARTLRDENLAKPVTDSLPAVSAAILNAQRRAGRTIYDTFIFHPELESLGKWYRQLMGESTGKAQDRAGKVIHAGVTPTVSIGSTDLHSVGQLYLGGPRDKYTTFLWSKESLELPVPADRAVPQLVPMISGKSASEVMAAILEGTKAAYRDAGLPYSEIVLDKISPRSIGAYLQFRMLEMMYLGELMNVNTFDQPNVESYKVVTRQILENRNTD